MDFISTFVKLLLPLGIIWLCDVRGSYAQNPVVALEATPAQLTITIPNNQVVDSSAYITVRLDNGLNTTDVLFYFFDRMPQVMYEYSSKLTATRVDRRLSMQFPSVTADLAGNFRCYSNAGNTIIADCGQLLIVIRKPKPPVVTLLPSSSVVVGSRLELLCEARSASLPPNHGLASEIWWYDQNGQSFGPTGSDSRVRVNSQNQLVLEPLERADKGRKFYCISADSTGNVNSRLESDKSDLFEVTPEYGPAIEDFRLHPPFKHDDVIEKKIGETMTYRCDAVCWPVCTITWVFKPDNGSTSFSPFPVSTDRTVLTFTVAKSGQGHYQCKAENKHGTAQQTFMLRVLYLDAPVVWINEEEKASARVKEDTRVSLKCVFDSNPEPVVKWLSPTQTMLSTQKASGPVLSIQDGLNKRLYTSTQILDRAKCEDSGVYKCDGNNHVNTAEGRMELVVTCEPSGTGIPGLELKQDYVWEISQPLSVRFVVRAFPEPNITQISSSLNGIPRKEEIPRDIEIVKTTNYGGKPYLTKFGLTSKRKLDKADTHRVYTMIIRSSEFTKDFAFRVFPREESIEQHGTMAPAESLNGGAMFGIIFAVIIIIIVIAAVLYFVVIKKRCTVQQLLYEVPVMQGGPRELRPVETFETAYDETVAAKAEEFLESTDRHHVYTIAISVTNNENEMYSQLDHVSATDEQPVYLQFIDQSDQESATNEQSEYTQIIDHSDQESATNEQSVYFQIVDQSDQEMTTNEQPE